MKASLYLEEYRKETIKNDSFYKLVFFDVINGYVFKTYIHEKEMLYIFEHDLLNNGTPKVIQKLKKEIGVL